MRKVLFTLLLLALAVVQASGHSIKTWMSSPTMVANGKTVTYLTVYQTTDDKDELYRDFEIHFSVPEGISIAKRKEGRIMVDDISLNAIRFDGLPQSLAVSMPNATSITAVCINTASKDAYYRDDENGNIVEELFTIGLIADPNMVSGKYELEMTVAKFALPKGGGSTLTSPARSTMTVTDGQGNEGEVLYTMSNVGYGTLILPFEATVPEGLSAYTCTGIDGTRVVMEAQGCIPANTPVLLAGNAGTYVFSGTSEATEGRYTSGLLTGVFKDTEIKDGYILKQQNGIIGFYVVDLNSPNVVPANRCYLNVPSGVKCLLIDEDVVDSINGVSSLSETQGNIYDLSGRPVQNEKLRGIIIKNRKRIAVK